MADLTPENELDFFGGPQSTSVLRVVFKDRSDPQEWIVHGEVGRGQNENIVTFIWRNRDRAIVVLSLNRDNYLYHQWLLDDTGRRGDA